VIFSLGAGPALGATRLVPADFATIQAAIDGAADGDEVLVSDGVYTGPGNRDIDFHGKRLQLRSVNGAEKTVIDCEDAGRAFLFQNNEGPETLVSGFTITHGQAPFGGGVSIVNASPTFSDCIFLRNAAKYDEGFPTNIGGAICMSQSATVIERCRFLMNGAEHSGSGGAIYIDSSSPRISQSTFVGNFTSSAGNGGGAIATAGTSTATITACAFADNWTSEEGGAIYSGLGTAMVVSKSVFWNNYSEVGGAINSKNPPQDLKISNCQLVENRGKYDGGGISGAATINRCFFRGNHSYFSGGAVSGSGTIRNSLFQGNSSGRGGAVAARDKMTIINSTFHNNEASQEDSVGEGGAVAIYSSAPTTIANSILWGNLADVDTEIYVAPSAPRPRVFNSDINQSGFSGNSNIRQDPHFRDPASNDFRLPPYSPAVDAGSDRVRPGDLDFAGLARVVDGDNSGAAAVDMGAYECQPSFLLLASSNSDMSGATLLTGGVVSGNIYILVDFFLTEEIEDVTLKLDGRFFRRYQVPPYVPQSLDTRTIPDGVHTITASVRLVGQAEPIVISTPFLVANLHGKRGWLQRSLAADRSNPKIGRAHV